MSSCRTPVGHTPGDHYFFSWWVIWYLFGFFSCFGLVCQRQTRFCDIPVFNDVTFSSVRCHTINLFFLCILTLLCCVAGWFAGGNGGGRNYPGRGNFQHRDRCVRSRRRPLDSFQVTINTQNWSMTFVRDSLSCCLFQALITLFFFSSQIRIKSRVKFEI